MRLKEDNKKTTKNKNRNIKNKKGSFMRLFQNGSIPGRLEASHVINENYQAVVDKVKELQNEFLKAHRPDLLDENDGEAAAGAAEAGPPP